MLPSRMLKWSLPMCALFGVAAVAFLGVEREARARMTLNEDLISLRISAAQDELTATSEGAAHCIVGNPSTIPACEAIVQVLIVHRNRLVDYQQSLRVGFPATMTVDLDADLQSALTSFDRAVSHGFGRALASTSGEIRTSEAFVTQSMGLAIQPLPTQEGIDAAQSVFLSALAGIDSWVQRQPFTRESVSRAYRLASIAFAFCAGLEALSVMLVLIVDIAKTGEPSVQ